MAYSGKFTPKNIKKYRGDWKNIIYRSMWERHAFNWCDTTSEVLGWSSEEVVIPYVYDIDKKFHRYFMDLRIDFKGGKTIIVEIKPKKETVPPINPGRKTKKYLNEGLTYIKNQNKWEAAKKYADKRGWEFHIWTEDTLNAMGIMPKPVKRAKAYPKKLKPYPKSKKTFKPFPKKK